MGRHSSDSEEENRSRKKKKHRKRSSSSSSSDGRTYSRKKSGKKSRSRSREGYSHSYDKRRRHRSSSESSYSSRRKRSSSRSKDRGRTRKYHKSRTSRSKSRHRQRTRSRSSDRSSRRRSRSKSYDRERGKGKDKSKMREKERGKIYLTGYIPIHFYFILNLAKADEALRAKERSEEEARKRKEEDQSVLLDHVKRAKEIELIESDSFVPQAFRSSRDTKASTESIETKHESAILGTGTIDLFDDTKESEIGIMPTTIKYLDDNCLAHPNLYIEKEEAELKWYKQLTSLRQERLMGSPVA
uniref:Arginine/serine-rich coiled-coil 1 n=1 Tax=Xenopus tropicalis TaxID=8364 RepID=A0A6I8QZ91_XENTR